MKKLYVSLLLVFVSLTAWADIPAGKTIYLDVSANDSWCCHKSYYLYFSDILKAYRMTPDPNNEGVYKFVTQSNMSEFPLYFVYRDDRTDSFVAEWLDFGYNKVMPNDSWREGTPYYIIDADNNLGHWASSPVSTGKSSLGNIQTELTYECATGYTLHLSVSFDGAPCGLLIDGALLSQSKKVSHPSSPYQYDIEDINVTEGQTLQIVVSLCSDTRCTEPTESRTIELIVPAKDDCANTQTITICKGDTTTLVSSMDAEIYLWKSNDPSVNGATTQSVTIPTDRVGRFRYSVESYKTVATAEKNLMSGGDFESTYGFVSDYQYAGKFDAGSYHNYYGSPGHLSYDLYALVGNTYDFWHSFEEITPHSGNYLGLFDAGKDGYAWQAFTKYPSDPSKNNNNLVVRKDSIYYFSYCVAHPNNASESANPAILQFVISYNGGNTIEILSTDTVSVADHDWHEKQVLWKAKMSSNNVMIGVRNLRRNSEENSSGNDFCLDDIMFQTMSYSSSIVTFTNYFEVIVEDCDCPAITPTAQDTTVCVEEMPYTWHGHTFAEADTWTDTVVAQATGCDSLITRYTLQTKVCTVPCHDLIYRKWTDFLFVDNSDSLYTSFQWYYEQTPIEGATEQYYRVPNPQTQTGEFHVVLNGSIETCPATLSGATPSATLYPAETNKNLVSKRTYPIFTHFTIVVYTYDDGTIETKKYLQN